MPVIFALLSPLVYVTIHIVLLRLVFLLFELFMNIQIITEDFLLHVIISLSLHICICSKSTKHNFTIVKNIFLLNLLVHSREQNQQNLTTRSPTNILVKIKSYSWSTLCISRIRTLNFLPFWHLFKDALYLLSA